MGGEGKDDGRRGRAELPVHDKGGAPNFLAGT